MREKVILEDENFRSTLKRISLELMERVNSLEEVIIVGVYKGGAWLSERIKTVLEEERKIQLSHGYLDINLYRDDLSRIGYHPVLRKTDIPVSLDDKVVFLIDDVIYTGRTVRSALDALVDMGRPKRVYLCVMVDRGGREFPIQPDVCGIKLEAEHNEIVEVRFREIHGSDKIIVLKK